MSFPKIDLLSHKKFISNLSTNQISHRSIGINTNNEINSRNEKIKSLKNSITSHNSRKSLLNSKIFPLFSNNLLRNRHELNIDSYSFQPLIVRNNVISFNNKNNNLIAFDDKEIINFFKNQTKSNFNNKYNIIFKTKNDKKKEQIKNCFNKIKNGICINEINLELKNNFNRNKKSFLQKINKNCQNKKFNSCDNLNDENFFNFKNRISSAKKIRIQTLNFFYAKKNKENNKIFQKHFKSNLNNYNFNINKIYSKFNNENENFD